MIPRIPRYQNQSPTNSKPPMRQNSLIRLGTELTALRRSSSQIKKIDQHVVLSDQKKLDLSGKIEELRLPLPTSLQVLDLSDNFGLDSSFIFGLEANLQTLRLNNCRIRELPSEMPSICENLKVFSLDGNELTSVPQWIFQIPEINEIGLFGNYIRYVEFPENNHLIKILNLSFNPLEDVKCNPGFNVQLLNFTQTKLQYVPDFPLESLKTLCLAKCALKGHIDFKICPHLASLDLSYNKIESVSEDFVNSCINLKNLNLCHNLIQSFPECFKCPPELTRFNASFNLLESFPAAFMDSLLLENLNLSNNKLIKLEPFKFRQLRNLNLSNNMLKELPDSFNISRYLTVLNVSFNQLTDLPRSIISCSEMSELNCTSNLFNHIPNSVFSLGTLRSLIFSNNTLTTIPDSLSGLFKLQTFDLSNNNITKFPSFISRLPELKTLSLSHNRIQEVTDVIFPQRLQSLDLSFNSLEKLKINQLNILENLLLQYNKLTELPNLLDFPSLQFFSIACNEIITGKINISENCAAEIEIYGNEGIEIPQKGRAHFSSVTPSDRYGIGVASTMGIRKTMEDTLTCTADDNNDLFLICDGHAGPNAARIISDFMDHSVEALGQSEDFAASIIQMLFKCNESIKAEHIIDGSTVAGMFVPCRDNEKCAYIIGIGDSRVVRVKQDSNEQLTVDQKPTNPDEYERLRKLGFCISSDGRVGRKLSVSRCLGDFWCSPQGLFIEPDIKKIEIDENDIGIIIGCDGLWDCVSNDIASEILRKSETAVSASIALKNLAIASGSQDNVSIIVILWHPKPGDEGISTRNTVAELPPYQEEVVRMDQVITQLPVHSRRRR